MARSLGPAYSDMKMAENRPMGTATHMAITVMTAVPTKIGMAPKAPDEPT